MTRNWLGELALACLWAMVTAMIAGTPLWVAFLRGTLVSEGRVGPVITGVAASAAVTAFASHRQWSLALSIVSAFELVVVIFANAIVEPTAGDGQLFVTLVCWSMLGLVATRYFVSAAGGR